jgi:predicted nucleic acid-binding protein
MEIVIDASAVLAVIANEPSKKSLIKLTKGAHLIAPASLHWEIGNALSAMLKRKRINLYQALRAVEIYNNIPIRNADIEIDHALRIAAESNIYAYDAYMIRCALRYNAQLLSLDKNLLETARKLGVETIEVEG